MFATVTAHPMSSSNTAQIVIGVTSSLFAAAILGLLLAGRKWIKREIVDPVKNLRTEFDAHVKDYKKKHRGLAKKVEVLITEAEVNEERSELERRAQQQERERVQP